MLTFWRHSLAVGVTARLLAMARGEADPERYYVSGLLHDIGRLLLFLREPVTMYEALVKRQARDGMLYEIEQELLGYDHGEAGAALLRSWAIPERLCAPIHYHHHPGAAGAFEMEAAVVHAADVIAGCLDYGSTGQRVVPPLDDGAWRRGDRRRGRP